MHIALRPPDTQPAAAPQVRRHKPARAKRYRAFQKCIRWEFGFTCAFCLVHELDFCPDGTAGTGAMTIEHLKPQSDREGQNDYDNLVYACRLCNNARRKSPLTSATGALLDPTQVAWANHFLWNDTELVPRAGDRDAARTAAVYDLNDANKVSRRESRRRLWKLWERRDVGREYAAILVEQATHEQSLERRLALLDKARAAREAAENAGRLALLLAAVPNDRPDGCRCRSSAVLTLPEWLARQAVVVDLQPD